AGLVSPSLHLFSDRARARGGLHSFPTRRSSDLSNAADAEVLVQQGEEDDGREHRDDRDGHDETPVGGVLLEERLQADRQGEARVDRKSTRLNSSHVKISYAVFCLKNNTRDGTQT